MPDETDWMGDSMVTLVIHCAACRATATFQDESFEDCWWSANMEGWEDRLDGKDYCPSCARSTKDDGMANESRRRH